MLIVAGLVILVNAIYLLYGLSFVSRLLLLRGALMFSSGMLINVPRVCFVKRFFQILWLPCDLLVMVVFWPLFLDQYRRIHKTLRMQLIR